MQRVKEGGDKEKRSNRKLSTNNTQNTGIQRNDTIEELLQF